MTSLGDSAVVNKLECIDLNAKNFNPPLSGVLNPLASDLDCNGAGGPYSLSNINNLKTDTITFTTINGAPIGSGTLDNPLLFDLNGNGVGGPYSFEGIGVGGCISVTATGAVGCKGIDATSGTYTTNTLTTTGEATNTGTITSTGQIIANNNCLFKNSYIINGNKTIATLNTDKSVNCDNIPSAFLVFPTTTPVKNTFNGLLTIAGDLLDSGKVSDVDLNVTGNITTTGNLLLNAGDPQRAVITCEQLQLPIIDTLGTTGSPLDLSAVEGGNIDLLEGGKGVVYAFSTFGPAYSITFSVVSTITNPLENGSVQVQSQIYNGTGALTPALTSVEIQATTSNKFKVSCFYDGPSQSTNAHRVSVIYTQDRQS